METKELYQAKYLVGWNHLERQLCLDITPTWKYHVDILRGFAKGFRPHTAGYFSHELDDKSLQTLKTYGSSEGFRILPGALDLKMLRAYLTDGEMLFNEHGDPV